MHSNAEHLEHMHESERRDAAAVAEKHELEVTGLRGTIEELETKLAKVSQDLNIVTTNPTVLSSPIS